LRTVSLSIVVFLVVLAPRAALAQAPVIATLAGTTAVNEPPVPGYTGDNGHARKARLALANPRNDCDPAQFEQISHVAIDVSGNLFISDSANHRIRRVDSNGIITTFAGSGQAPTVDPRTCVPSGSVGDGGSAAAARLYYPSGVAVHPAGGIVFADQQSNRIRMIDASGNIRTIAGNGLHFFYAPGIPASGSGMDWPTAVAVSPAGIVHFSELHSGRIARIDADGRLTTVAGTGIPGFNGDSGPATSIRLSSPTGIAFDAGGNLYIADQGNHRIRRVTPAGALTTVAGSAAGFAGDGGAASAALLNRPADVKADSSGNLYVSDMLNHRVRKIDAGGIITTIAGDGVAGRGPDGVAATASRLAFPTGLAVNSQGDIFVVDWNNYLVRRLSFRALPVIASNAALNAAGFGAPPLAPGSLITIFGANLALSMAEAAEAPWPMQLAGASVQVNGRPAPIYFASPTQINSQAPYETEAGEASITVSTEAGRSVAEFIAISAAAIGVFQFPGSRQAVALNQDNSLNSPEAAEEPGQFLTVFLTGIGAVDPDIATGASAGSATLHRAKAEISATVQGKNAVISFLGLTPGFVGLAQANLQIPDDAEPAAEASLVFSYRGQPMASALISIRRP
jgi:uncharacterized protein (TIGR03437 family)